MKQQELSSDIVRTLELIKDKTKIVAMLAPSFVVDFNYPDIVVKLKQLGFDKVCELTFGARIINRYYHRIIKEHPDQLFISSACPIVALMIKQHYPKYIDNLMPVVSPIGATARIMKKNYPKHKQVFIAPCPAKKEEAKMYGVEATITYKELKQLLSYAEENNLFKEEKPKSHLFDKFYADYTKIYPLSGGLSKTLHAKDILTAKDIIIVEGPIQLKQLFSKGVPDNVRFLDILFCTGGCIGGPGVATTDPIKERHKKVEDYCKFAKTEKIGTKRGLIKDTEGVLFNTPEDYISNRYFVETERDFEKHTSK